MLGGWWHYRIEVDDKIEFLRRLLVGRSYEKGGALLWSFDCFIGIYVDHGLIYDSKRWFLLFHLLGVALLFDYIGHGFAYVSIIVLCDFLLFYDCCMYLIWFISFNCILEMITYILCFHVATCANIEDEMKTLGEDIRDEENEWSTWCHHSRIKFSLSW